MNLQTTTDLQAVDSARNTFANPEQRWSALCARDASAEGRFVYAVVTTGVFCRPGCPSRRPLRANVRFFDTPALAAQAGFRPCKRCRPDAAPAASSTLQAIVKACRMLEAEGAVRTEQVAEQLGLSPSYLVRAFKRAMGITPQAYRRRVLAERARDGLAGASSVTEVAYSAGYASASRFYQGIGRELGMDPAEALAGAPGKRVQYAVRACSLGTMLVAWTERGVCEVCFEDEEDAAIATLRSRFPAASCAPTAAPGWVDQLLAAVERPQPLAVPLDIRGTAFQQRVWSELQRIPLGETRTYTDVACAIGEPRAVRAVANACARNPVAVVVPCHRVVRSDGALSGYRWGRARKQELLRRERAR